MLDQIADATPAIDLAPDAAPNTQLLEDIAALSKARDLIADPAHWCQRRVAKTIMGYAADPNSESAHSFCSYGALERSVGGLNSAENMGAYGRAGEHLRLTIGSNALGVWNDENSHATVLAAFDATIARLKAQL